MEFKGTPGPWKIAYGFECLPVDTYDKTILTVWGDDEEAKANVQAILYVCEMLEKLTECKTMFSKGKRLTTTDMAMMVDEINDLLTRATTI